jgi:hypothetical protein
MAYRRYLDRYQYSSLEVREGLHGVASLSITPSI